MTPRTLLLLLSTALLAVTLYPATLLAQPPAQGPPPQQPSAQQPAPPPGGSPARRRYDRSGDSKQPPMAADFHGPNSGGMSPGSRIAPSGIWWKNPDIIQKLTLTAEQQKKMDDIFQQSRIQLIDLKANVEKQQVTLEPMLAANPPDTNKVLAQIDKVAQSRAELEKANARMLLGIRTVLTADQWTKLQADRGNHHMMFPGKEGGPGGPGNMRGGTGGNRDHAEPNP